MTDATGSRSKARGTIDEGPGKAEPIGEVRGEGLDAEGFGRVVTAVEDIDTGVFSGGERPVRTLAGDESVDAFARGDREIGAGATGDHADSTAGVGSAGEQFHGMIEGVSEAVHEIGAADPGARLKAEPGIALMEEGREFAESEGAAKQDVVAEFGMGIEGEMSAVDGEVSLEEQSELLVARAGPRMRGGPEEAVVDQEEIGASSGGGLEGGEGGVDGGGDAGDAVVVLDLEAVDGAVPVLELVDAEESVAVTDDGGEGGGVHGWKKR